MVTKCRLVVAWKGMGMGGSGKKGTWETLVAKILGIEIRNSGSIEIKWNPGIG